VARKRLRKVVRLSTVEVSVSDRLQVLREEVEAHHEALVHLIDNAARAGATGEAISSALGISRVTLYRRFGRSLRAARLL
jgi:transcriptional regulator of acetoin/glycerol metabolism